MHEILSRLPAGSRVLDLGSGPGSFAAGWYPLRVVRLDLEPGRLRTCPDAVAADAARLPFRSAAFDAVIANHSLEHVAGLDACLEEIGRVLRPEGAFFLAVPDARTLTDRLYRRLARGGGHVNAFTSARALAARVEAATALSHVATRPLFTSLSFLNAKNRTAPAPRSLLVLGNGNETVLMVLTYLLRLADRALGTRLSLYGWASYFGGRGLAVDESGWSNVCVRCGAGHPAAALRPRRAWRLLRAYACPNCGAKNLFTADPACKAPPF